MFTLYHDDLIGNPGNCFYPHNVEVTDANSLIAAIGHDNVCAEYRNSYRNVKNFIAMLLADARYEATYQRRRYWNKAHYSLDRGDGIEHDALFVSVSPCEIYERKVTYEQLYAAIASLPDKQAKRIYAHYFLGMSKGAIAKAEGVNKSQITRSIQAALTRIETFLKKVL
ncbi:MAG: RNA polymerase sigma factor [Anaerofustis sp.]